MAGKISVLFRYTVVSLIISMAFVLRSATAAFSPPEPLIQAKTLPSLEGQAHSTPETVADPTPQAEADPILQTETSLTSVEKNLEPENNSNVLISYGKIAYEHLKYISNDIGPRLAGTEGERTAKEYLKSAFENLGYEVEIQDFAFLVGGVEKYSSNVAAEKKGETSKTVIVGAHYDSVNAANGADDNASGISVLLEAAERLKNVQTEYTIKFVAFGAEEYGWWGSKHYAAQLDDEGAANVVVMINLDSLISGDSLYVYGSEGEKGWVRDEALKISRQLSVDMITSPGTNEKYPLGTTGDWSDHVSFVRRGVPYAYFEATNWEIGELDGYTQTVKDGMIYHTRKDTLGYLEENYPGRVQEHLEAFSHVLVELIKSLGK